MCEASLEKENEFSVWAWFIYLGLGHRNIKELAGTRTEAYHSGAKSDMEADL